MSTLSSLIGHTRFIASSYFDKCAETVRMIRTAVKSSAGYISKAVNISLKIRLSSLENAWPIWSHIPFYPIILIIRVAPKPQAHPFELTGHLFQPHAAIASLVSH
jgi:hypothetical protein